MGCLYIGGVAKRLLLLLAVLALVGVVGTPWIYAHYIEGPPEASLRLSTERHPATTDMTGTWKVTAGSGDQAKRSQAGYRADQKLLWESVTVTGRTNGVTGSAVVVGTTLQSANFVVDVASIQSSHRGRDKRFRSTDVMASDRFPTARLNVSELVDLASVPANGAPTTIEVPADLTLKDVTRHVEAQLDIARSGDRVEVAGQIPVVFSDYSVTPPAPFAGILAVQPVVTIEFLVNLVRE